ncbi:hypothetical protein [Chitinophaga sp.]|uniref:hypothetical protein n=1 Tax=Chitinophaga sp. TaxID=1869181 RepID=UPI002F94AF1B
MKQKLRNISLKISVWIYVIPVIFFFILITFILIPRLQLLIGEMQLLDVMFKGYDATYVHQLFDKLQSGGRGAYLSLELYADIPFIFLYVITFTMSIAKLLVRNGLWDGLLYYSLFFPVLAGLSDLAENIGIINMLQSKNDIPGYIIKLTSYSTILKGYLLPLTLLTLISLLGVMWYKKLR